MIVVAQLKARKGEEKKLEDALKEMIPSVADEEGTLVYTLHRSQKDPATFLFYEKYKDGKALKAHGETAHFRALGPKIKDFLDGPMQIDLYEEIGGIPIKS